MKASKFTDAQKVFIIKQGEKNTAGTTHAISLVMSHLGAQMLAALSFFNIAANMTGINGAITNALTMDNGTISNLSNTPSAPSTPARSYRAWRQVCRASWG